MILLYNFFIRIYVLAIRIAAAWNIKAKEWINGRKNLFRELEQKISKTKPLIWMHCASAGEFEQGKPVIESLKKNYPAYQILISFFSPSGFAVAKNYKDADVISYLPADTKYNAEKFISIVKPSLVIFVKYEFWYHHLSAAVEKKIPILLISSIFRKEQIFFKWYGSFFRKILFLFSHIFVQDDRSLQQLKSININHCSVGGDTRFDRVKKIRDHFSELPLIKAFTGESKKVLIAGSTWPDDEVLFTGLDEGIKLIIAPHETTADHIAQLEKFPSSVRYSTLQKKSSLNPQVLIIDHIGMLSKIYYYATICYIGGGFNKSGIHNTLEPAVYGKPLIFGPQYKKFRESRELVEAGAAFSISTAEELKTKTDHLFNDREKIYQCSKIAEEYVLQNTGASEKITGFIQENRLLTN